MTDEESTAERLARRAADRAAQLAVADAEKATKLAVARAVKDANIDRDLLEHGKHLQEINGSQRQMAKALEVLNDKFGEFAESLKQQVIATNAVNEYVRQHASFKLARWKVITTILTIVAAYATIIVLIFTKA